MNKLSKVEQETIILFNEAEDTATVYTHNKALQNRLDGFCAKNQSYSFIKTAGQAKTYKVPKKCVSVRFPKVLKEETRAKMANLARERFTKKESPHTAPLNEATV